MIGDGLVRPRRWSAGLRLLVFGAVIVLVVALAITAITRVMADPPAPATADAPTESPAAAPLRTPAGLARLAAAPGDPAPGGDPARSTLVLYDEDGAGAFGNQTAIQVGNLVSHSSAWNLQPVRKYRAGELDQYTGAIFVGVGDAPLPTTFLDDVSRSQIPVLWMGRGIDQLFEADPDAQSRLGWSPGDDDPVNVTSVRYKKQSLPRKAEGDATTVRITVHNPASARVRGVAQHDDGSTTPWAVTSGSLTYISEVPFDYAEPGDRSLAAADLISHTARPGGPDRRRALIRIEDVGPNSDPADIRAISDYLAKKGVPFTLAVYPYYRDPNGAAHNGKRVSFRLVDQPEMVDALNYALQRGAVLTMHGLSHQFGDRGNPYRGTSADDYEFYRAHVDEANNVKLDGPVPQDSKAWAKDRMQMGRAEFRRVGLPDPEFFEFPHYTGSMASYRAANEVFGVRYDQGTYFAALCPDGRCDRRPAKPGELFQQFFPYLVRDVYGSVVIPENLLNVSSSYNNNPPRSVRDVLGNAQAMSVVRDAVVSAYYHPFLGTDRLAQVVEGIEKLGYEFVSPYDLLE
jgi:uncharacterized protein YdaL